MSLGSHPLFKVLHKTAILKPEQPLKVGQMIPGRIVNLLPGQRAMIQVGNRQFQAQLEVPLKDGERYMFQVTSTDDTLKLKMISTQATPSGRRDSFHLLRQLGIKATKDNVDFFLQLIKQGSMFTISDLTNAFEILQRHKGTIDANETLLQMFQKQMPIKTGVFEALMARQTLSLTDQFAKMYDHLSRSKAPVQKQLVDLLGLVSGKQRSRSFQEAAATKLLSESSQGTDTTFSLFKQAGVIANDVNYEQYRRSFLRAFSTRGGSGLDIELIVRNYISTRKSIPFLPSSHQAETALRRLFEQQLPLSSRENNVLVEWSKQLKGGITGSQTLSDTLINKIQANHQSIIQSGVFDKLVPFLGSHTTSILSQGSNHLPGSTEPTLKALSSLETLLAKQVPDTSKAALIEWAVRTNTLQSNRGSKETILAKMKMMHLLSGINHESNVKKQLAKGEQTLNEGTIKALLLQNMQEHPSLRQDAMRQLVQLLNGVQLTSHQEMGQMLQLALTFPGDLLNVNKDIHLNMEGKKNKKGEIDPDYCHIMFFLDLEHLQETVIDLSIVERRVAVTIYNQMEAAENLISEHKSALTSGLLELGYELTSVKVLQSSHQNKPIQTSQINKEHKGVDIRI
ncbi:hypothetical protein MUO14_22955 [Halobacillus shinanisalinarum]|uniref:Flagellar hook-length control protein FliK n=1 Tax=Halobacillus shinanisalinarum TaxID=2932258 RepID=A0ABY4GYD0_9BACI|nr:hypothetical protein [Halobacillus shinanisalinarum]UOQ93205.1 hypothetical protein MUO14_22955 [Halobacillus shinanisalinarum]